MASASPYTTGGDGIKAADIPKGRLPLQSASVLFLIVDIIFGALSAITIFWIYGEARAYPESQLWYGLVIFLVTWLLSAQAMRLYKARTLISSRKLIQSALRTWAIAFGLILLIGFGVRIIGGFSRLWLFGWAMTMLLWVVTTRSIWTGMVRHMIAAGACNERAAILSANPINAARYAGLIEQESKGLIRVALRSGFAGPGFADTTAGASIGQFETIEQEIRSGTIDRVYIAGWQEDDEATEQTITRLRRLAVNVTVLPELGSLLGRAIGFSHVGRITAVDVLTRPLKGWNGVLKRAEDLIIGGLALLVCLPLFILIAIALKLDSRGPIFFRQRRVGFHDEIFRVWKFRTMYVEATDETASRQTSRGDPRVTRLGALLRATSLDELPQLINVVRGEMSLVGPRPHAIGTTVENRPLQQVVEEYAVRHRIRPGITGWAQVNGFRGELTSREAIQQRVKYDLDYINSWSLLFDLWIIMLTVRLIWTDQAAY